jgi:hypothetical protein
LKEAQIEVEFWLKILSGIRTHYMYKTQLAQLVRKLPTKIGEQYDLDKNCTQLECQIALQQAWCMRYKGISGNVSPRTDSRRGFGAMKRKKTSYSTY